MSDTLPPPIGEALTDAAKAFHVAAPGAGRIIDTEVGKDFAAAFGGTAETASDKQPPTESPAQPTGREPAELDAAGAAATVEQTIPAAAPVAPEPIQIATPETQSLQAVSDRGHKDLQEIEITDQMHQEIQRQKNKELIRQIESAQTIDNLTTLQKKIDTSPQEQSYKKDGIGTDAKAYIHQFENEFIDVVGPMNEQEAIRMIVKALQDKTLTPTDPDSMRVIAVHNMITAKKALLTDADAGKAPDQANQHRLNANKYLLYALDQLQTAPAEAAEATTTAAIEGTEGTIEEPVAAAAAEEPEKPDETVPTTPPPPPTLPEQQGKILSESTSTPNATEEFLQGVIEEPGSDLSHLAAPIDEDTGTTPDQIVVDGNPNIQEKAVVSESTELKPEPIQEPEEPVLPKTLTPQEAAKAILEQHTEQKTRQFYEQMAAYTFDDKNPPEGNRVLDAKYLRVLRPTDLQKKGGKHGELLTNQHAILYRLKKLRPELQERLDALRPTENEYGEGIMNALKKEKDRNLPRVKPEDLPPIRKELDEARQFVTDAPARQAEAATLRQELGIATGKNGAEYSTALQTQQTQRAQLQTELEGLQNQRKNYIETHPEYAVLLKQSDTIQSLEHKLTELTQDLPNRPNVNDVIQKNENLADKKEAVSTFETDHLTIDNKPIGEALEIYQNWIKKQQELLDETKTTKPKDKQAAQDEYTSFLENQPFNTTEKGLLARYAVLLGDQQTAQTDLTNLTGDLNENQRKELIDITQKLSQVTPEQREAIEIVELELEPINDQINAKQKEVDTIIDSINKANEQFKKYQQLISEYTPDKVKEEKERILELRRGLMNSAVHILDQLVINAGGEAKEVIPE